jgi:hypothetical protein
MGRPLRVQVDNGSYHVTMEATDDWPFFYDADDYVRFLRIAGYVVERNGWKLHAAAARTAYWAHVEEAMAEAA